MSEFKQLYVAYAYYGDQPVHIELLDHERYEAFKNRQPQDDRIHQAKIHVDNTRPDDPIIEILALTEFQSLSQELAKQIKQEVINWLIDNRHISRR